MEKKKPTEYKKVVIKVEKRVSISGETDKARVKEYTLAPGEYTLHDAHMEGTKRLSGVCNEIDPDSILMLNEGQFVLLDTVGLRPPAVKK